MNQIKKRLWVLSFCITASISQSQGLEDISASHAVFNTDTEFDDGAGITVSRLTATQIYNLAVLGKVWGFLKYHHPRLVAGELNWDYELFRILPDLLDATDELKRNNLLSDWVHQLGRY